MLYYFTFGSEDVGRSVWPQIIKMAAGVGGSFLYLVLLRPFAAERFVQSLPTQKTFCKVFKELSNGIR